MARKIAQRTFEYSSYHQVSMAKRISIAAKALQSREAIELLSNKWRITIIHILRDGPLRTNEIQAAIAEVSPKVLTQTLRGMERDGLVHREIYPVVPPRVEYKLTPMGRSLIQPLEDLCHWAKAHMNERNAARTRFDTMPAGKKSVPARQPATRGAK